MESAGIRRRLEGMTQEELVERIKGLLKTDEDLSFLLKLGLEELRILVARRRKRVDRVGR
jgi:hypothetical protein